MLFGSKNNSKAEDEPNTIKFTSGVIIIIIIITFLVGLLINYNVTNVRLGTNLQACAFIGMILVYYFNNK